MPDPFFPAPVFKWCLLSFGPRALVLSCHPPVYLSWTPDAIIYHHIVSCHLCFLFAVSIWTYNIDGNTYFSKNFQFDFHFSFISYLTKAGSVIHTASVIGSWNHLQFRSSLLINGHTPLSLSRLILCCAEKKMMGWCSRWSWYQTLLLHAFTLSITIFHMCHHKYSEYGDHKGFYFLLYHKILSIIIIVSIKIVLSILVRIWKYHNFRQKIFFLSWKCWGKLSCLFAVVCYPACCLINLSSHN